jgi:hypothetical protein
VDIMIRHVDGLGKAPDHQQGIISPSLQRKASNPNGPAAGCAHNRFGALLE